MAQNKFFGADNLECRARIDTLNDGCLNCLGKKNSGFWLDIKKCPLIEEKHASG